jgi:4-hydroxy 2-oxovalerate aldolase
MNSIKVLDVTLRDGGCVNDFNFGQVYMEKILKAQEESGVDMIEMGYLDDNKGSLQGRTQWKTSEAIYETLMKTKKQGVTYLAIMDYGKFNVDNLPQCSDKTIDGIRVAFHKKNMRDIPVIGRKIMDKGYQFYIQPMITMRYSDREMLDLIEMINKELPDASACYIVDSFGEMRPNDLQRLLNIVDNNLVPTMTIGFHSHNNLQMSYSNACSMLQFPTNRDLMLDSSILGMGKGAGNLNSELLLEHLNLFYGKKYNISPLLEVIDKVLNQLHSEFYWGYAPEYYLSSVNHCTPSYASHFYNKHQLPIDEVGELLSMIPEDKKISFDKNFAEEIWRTYNERKQVDDSEVVVEMKSILANKKVLLIAPGKSIVEHRSKIESIINQEDVISIGLNLTESYHVDYLMTTRQDVYDLAMEAGKSVITTSNVSKGARGKVKILNYKNWIDISDGRTHDSSSVIMLNFLKACDVKEIMLAGFDGFAVNINENYSDPNLRRPVSVEQVNRRNAFYKRFIKEVDSTGIRISFVTPSKYE